MTNDKTKALTVSTDYNKPEFFIDRVEVIKTLLNEVRGYLSIEVFNGLEYVAFRNDLKILKCYIKGTEKELDDTEKEVCDFLLSENNMILSDKNKIIFEE